jgi:hypothetical protein
MIDRSARSHWAPTKCHELSDSTARWGLRSCMAAKSRHSPAFEQGRALCPAPCRLLRAGFYNSGMADRQFFRGPRYVCLSASGGYGWQMADIPRPATNWGDAWTAKQRV